MQLTKTGSNCPSVTFIDKDGKPLTARKLIDSAYGMRVCDSTRWMYIDGTWICVECWTPKEVKYGSRNR